MSELTPEELASVAREVTGLPFEVRHARTIMTPDMKLWDPRSIPENRVALEKWIAGKLVNPIRDGDLPYTSMKLYEFAEAIAEDDTASLQRMVLELRTKS